MKRDSIRYFEMGGLPIHCGIAFTEKAYQREMRRLKVSDPNPFIKEGGDATCHRLQSPGKCLYCLITVNLKKKRTASQLYALLVHECVHCWQSVRDEMQETSPSHEFEAYTIQWLTQQCFSALSEFRQAKYV